MPPVPSEGPRRRWGGCNDEGDEGDAEEGASHTDMLAGEAAGEAGPLPRERLLAAPAGMFVVNPCNASGLAIQ